MSRFFKPSLLLLGLLIHGCAAEPETVEVRIATLNVAMGLPGAADLPERLEGGSDQGLASLAEILQRVRPDILLLNEFDFQPGPNAANWLQENYLEKSWNGQESIEFPYAFSAPVNTGVDSGLDLDNNGRTGDPADAWGYGVFPGQYGMLVLSRFPIDLRHNRTFREFRWRDLPGAMRPEHENGESYYPDEIWNQLKLSSKSHWDLALDVHGSALHFLVSHPTPSVFDGPEDRNGKRNHDEIRLWADYVQPGTAGYLVDDGGTAGGLPEGSLFVIAGDLNADPNDGESAGRAIMQLLDHSQIDASCVPRSKGGLEATIRQARRNLKHYGDPAADTADFNDDRVGNLRVDYVLPSTGLNIADCGVYWPADDEPGHDLVGFSDHRLVWMDIVLPAAH